jgi:hypothetical protein
LKVAVKITNEAAILTAGDQITPLVFGNPALAH